MDIPKGPRPYFNHSVEFKKNFTEKERTEALEKAGLNVFFFPAEMITGCDLLSDSGTTTMTNEQWAAMHLGDESYGSNRGYFLLKSQIEETFGGKYLSFIFHQGRAAENALFSFVGGLGKDLIIPSNGHFDTTEANIKANKIKALNLFCPEFKDKNSNSNFKGDMDTEKLKELLLKQSEKIPLVYLTITNNTGGGQPVSLKNIKEVSVLAHEHGIPFFLDACRFAENAWFIKNCEKGYEKKEIKAIVKEIFSYADGFTISFKKDGLVNMGGGIFIKPDGFFAKKYPQAMDKLTNHQITTEGHPTYGGLTGRDIMALSSGLTTVLREDYLNYRIGQLKDFGRAMEEKGLPIVTPVSGHAVYLDINKFFEGTQMKPGDFGGISFTAKLLSEYGHRACELGNFAFGSYDKKTDQEKFPEINYVRFAVPRLRYEKRDLDSVAEAAGELYKNRDKIPGVNVIYGKDLPLRHFKARFEFKR